MNRRLKQSWPNDFSSPNTILAGDQALVNFVFPQPGGTFKSINFGSRHHTVSTPCYKSTHGPTGVQTNRKSDPLVQAAMALGDCGVAGVDV